MRRTSVAVPILALAVLAGGAKLQYNTTPQHALRQIERAVETRDLPLLEKHVDVESVLDAAVDDLLAASKASAALESHAPADAIGEQTRPRLATIVRDVVLSAILAVGTVPGRGPEVDIAEVQHDGRTARVIMRLAQAQSDSTIVLDLALEKRAGGWSLVQIVNLADHIESIGEAQ